MADLSNLQLPYPPVAPVVLDVLARYMAPRKALKVSEWADQHRRLSSKGSAEHGQWRTSRNPPLREPMDCWSTRHPARVIVCRFPIQLGKTEIALNCLGYTMHHRPGPVMVCLPGEVSQQKWVAQKLQPMIDESPAVRGTLTSLASREASNSRTFKDFAGGQLFIEHAGSPARLKSTTVRDLIVDEVDEFARNFAGSGGDPLAMLDGRTSAFPSNSKRLYISTPELKGTSRIDHLWEQSDQRRYHVACPHCGHSQHLQWSGLRWSSVVNSAHSRRAWYVCEDCGAEIQETHKPAMLEAGIWVPGVAEASGRVRGYTLNGLYYPIGLGPRWPALVDEWLAAQGDPARLKTFTNDRLAEPWEDASTRNVRSNAVAERAEAYALRTVPGGVLGITAGVDTQDDRLELHIVGWGRAMAFWTLDYVILPGDPALDDVWLALTEILNRPLQRDGGGLMSVEAVSVDMFGHRTEDVKAWVRSRRVRRPMASFGATSNTAPVLGKAKLADVNWRGKTDKRGVHIYQLGTVNAKHWLYARLAADHQAQDDWERLADGPEKPAHAPRLAHFSDALPPEFFTGLVSEVFNPAKNRFEKRRGVARNEPLDTWVHAFAAAHHPELRFHRNTAADWESRAKRLQTAAQSTPEGAAPVALAGPGTQPGRAGNQSSRIVLRGGRFNGDGE